MDLRVFYQKIRAVEESISEPHVVVVSIETPDGGRAGRRSEVARAVAARMVVEGRCRLASVEEAEEYHVSIAEARKSALESVVWELRDGFIRRRPD